MIKNIVGKVRVNKVDCANIEHLYALQTLAAISPKGIFVECGVFKGGSAAPLINLGRETILCDTFTGLPEQTKEDKGSMDNLSKGRFAYQQKEVEKNLKNLGLSLSKVKMIKGMVEKTIPLLAKKLTKENKKIALLHLDVDFYSGTKVCLKYLMPLMAKNGFIVIHDYSDYSKAAGINIVVDEILGAKNIIFISAYSICWINK